MESHKTTSSNYILRAINLRAENLVVLHKKHKDDAFLVLEFRGLKKTTEPSSIAEKTEWKEDFKWDLHSQELKHDEFVKIKIYQKESFWRNRMLGKAKVCLQNLLEREENKLHLDIPLTDNYVNPVEPQCKFLCELEYIFTTQNGQGKSKSTESEKKGKMAPEMTNDNAKVQELVKKSRFSLSDKPINFQIRVKIFEARQLEGNNISPVTRVTVGNKRRQTSVQKSTNRPYFNQSLIYNFDAIKPSDLFSKQIKFEIFDSGMIRTGSLLGYFKCDVGFVYDWKDHCLLRKWLLLIEPNDGESLSKKQDASKNGDRDSIDDERAHAGYLKASVVVLHPGATAPSMEDIGCDLDQDDLETNLIRPPGVVLTPAVFKVKIYRADDLPQMDPNVVLSLKKVLGIKREPKHLVDPYCVVSFAGAKRSTKICYNSSSPTFQEVLNVPFQAC
ncbi:dysferlin-like isoform X2 [Xenia sp. Carnegie-2017]|uniref:dysferlin-like isoform X2 n=1 Tax=Xenia sp. Carnegie-2017 TaxID=2897299 RepID=UPI001F042E80|nr:dysferlin-like isoform X2 [Xenia sp. Carnegie-2017]